MQSIELCGFTVNCEACDYIPYMDFKTKLEYCVNGIKKQLDNKRQISPACHFIRLDRERLFSIYIDTESELHVGIYRAATKSIQQNCQYQDISDMETEDLNMLYLRMSNLIFSKGKINASTTINQVWKIHVEALREKETGYDKKELDGINLNR